MFTHFFPSKNCRKKIR